MSHSTKLLDIIPLDGYSVEGFLKQSKMQSLKSFQYKRRLEEQRGKNFQYLNNESYAELERKGYEFDKPIRSIACAKEKVEENRKNGYHSRIVCWAQGQIRMREYIVIRKKKTVKEKPKQIEIGEWIYKGCYIQESVHPRLVGKYEVFKNNENQDHVGRCFTFAEAKKMAEANECFDNHIDWTNY